MSNSANEVLFATRDGCVKTFNLASAKQQVSLKQLDSRFENLDHDSAPSNPVRSVLCMSRFKLLKATSTRSYILPVLMLFPCDWLSPSIGIASLLNVTSSFREARYFPLRLAQRFAVQVLDRDFITH